MCKAVGNCHHKTLTCPSQCPQKKPKQNKNGKGCFINCSSKCEATCRSRKPNCIGYGSLCYDPHFVGADGVVFYFHESKGGNFAIVSYDTSQINAYFIGTRPQGRTRDFTWVQALSVIESVNIPTNGDAEWRTNGEERETLVERTDNTNSIIVQVAGLVETHIKVRPIGKEENRVHNYRLLANDAFAHYETQFKFSNPSDLVEGVLGKTYRSDYVSPIKPGVAMPTIGGEDKYQTPSLFAPLCKACKFQGLYGNIALNDVAQFDNNPMSNSLYWVFGILAL
ncbi:hypothetical protein FEM48_Zijuj02G0092600 [Ziziphus jujuba var. spinosa]|uniref:Uncharacterized protein n=1 Tax=Ziziphus jujuba var. spinosa TaxID=714518 RepID=A0A978VUW8_ZIZJJ|nr:hypothetical protein FEM48_Zijuj02G0092600 [Ziziphus jujuba var. spinosa]